MFGTKHENFVNYSLIYLLIYLFIYVFIRFRYKNIHWMLWMKWKDITSASSLGVNRDFDRHKRFLKLAMRQRGTERDGETNKDTNRQVGTYTSREVHK